jgi:hypothetical protein
MKVRVHLSDYLFNVINKGDSAEKNYWYTLPVWTSLYVEVNRRGNPWQYEDSS